MATTGLNDHVVVSMENDIAAVVVVKHRYCTQFGGRTAGLRNNRRIQAVYQSLYDGVVCRIHVSIERKGTPAKTEERRVTKRSDDPVLPAQALKADIQHSPTAALFARTRKTAPNVREVRGPRRTAETLALPMKSAIRDALVTVLAVERHQERTLLLRTVKTDKPAARRV